MNLNLNLPETFSPSYIETRGIPKLIGICGHAGAGKDTVAAYLTDHYKDVYSLSFAGPLKEAAAVAFGIPLKYFNSPSLKEQELPGYGVTPRMIAQYMGTEMFRNLSSVFWVHRLIRTLEGTTHEDDPAIYDSGDTVVITDVRFQNEIDFIAAHNGIIIHLSRPGATGAVGIPAHASETPATQLNFPGGKTYVIQNNGTIKDLYKKVAELFVDLLIPEAPLPSAFTK